MTGIRIIAVLGSSASGKSTTAQYLVEKHGFTRVRFAQALKDMLVCAGLTKEQVDGPQEVREQPLDLLCGKTPRYAMQTLGTEWRDMIGKELWANIARSRISDMIANGVTNIVIDDMRFLHEAAMFREIGCEIWAVRRPDVEPSRGALFFAHLPIPKFVRALAHVLFGLHSAHVSETEWFKIERDIEIMNTGTLDDLYTAIERNLS